MGDEGTDRADDELDAFITERLGRLWDAYRDDDAALGVTLGAELVARLPDNGEMWFWYGCCLERMGQLNRADHCFLRARSARQEPQAGPFRVSWRHFRQAVDAAADSLSEPLRAVLEEVSLVLADYADPGLLEGHAEPELLGLFEGLERGELEAGGVSDITPRIHLFRRAHEHATATRAEFDHEVRQTLWHELGHYLGHDEDDLDQLGLG
jgi:predicted Zn-dependent protease with MMP-like domain